MVIYAINVAKQPWTATSVSDIGHFLSLKILKLTSFFVKICYRTYCRMIRSGCQKLGKDLTQVPLNGISADELREFNS